MMYNILESYFHISLVGKCCQSVCTCMICYTCYTNPFYVFVSAVSEMPRGRPVAPTAIVDQNDICMRRRFFWMWSLLTHWRRYGIALRGGWFETGWFAPVAQIFVPLLLAGRVGMVSVGCANHVGSHTQCTLTLGSNGAVFLFGRS